MGFPNHGGPGHCLWADDHPIFWMGLICSTIGKSDLMGCEWEYHGINEDKCDMELGICVRRTVVPGSAQM